MLMRALRGLITLLYFFLFQEYENLEYPQRVGRQKHVLDIDIRFKDTRGGGRGRGGRGLGRGGPRVGLRTPNVPAPEKIHSVGYLTVIL